jgi:hypothetical protein
MSLDSRTTSHSSSNLQMANQCGIHSPNSGGYFMHHRMIRQENSGALPHVLAIEVAIAHRWSSLNSGGVS